MPWTIERKHDHVAVVTMNTNKVNAQNPPFFDDLHAAFDRLEAELDFCAAVLTGDRQSVLGGPRPGSSLRHVHVVYRQSTKPSGVSLR